MNLIDRDNNKKPSQEIEELRTQETKLTEDLNVAEKSYVQLSKTSAARERQFLIHNLTTGQSREVFDREHPIVVTTKALEEARSKRDGFRQELTKVQQQRADLTFANLLNQTPRKTAPSSTSDLIDIIVPENVDPKKTL